MYSLNLNYEKNIWKQGQLYVCGMDEVGRGAFSGPVVVACIGFSSDLLLPADLYVNDSKKLTQKQRNMAYLWIINNCYFYGIGQMDNAFIDKFGILEALKHAKQIAFNQAMSRLKEQANSAEINRVMIDGNDKHVLEGLPESSQINIIRGDSQIFSIACASIIAKVYRDALMQSYSLHPKYNTYSWSRNKGYGTKEHIECVKRYGTSDLHRITFVRKYV